MIVLPRFYPVQYPLNVLDSLSVQRWCHITSLPPPPNEGLLAAVVRVVVVVRAVVREEILRQLRRVRDQVDLVPEQSWASIRIQ